MKIEFKLVHSLKTAVQGLLLCSSLLIGGSVSAQNLVKNPGFESAIGTNAAGNYWGGANFPIGTSTGAEATAPSLKATWNWMIAYPWGGPDDFEIKDRETTVQNPGRPNYFSACFRPSHGKWAHAYYTQTITNLEPNHAYTVSGWMMEDWWKGTTDAKRDKYLVYIEAIGGQGSPTPDGRSSVLAAVPPDPNLDAPYTYPDNTWRKFTAQQTPDSNGQIEIRLHEKMPSWVESDKLILMNGYFDDISLTYSP